MKVPGLRLVPLGVDAVRFGLPAGVDRAAVLASLRDCPGVRDVVVAEATAAVWFDPDGPVPAVAAALDHPRPAPPPVEHTLPVRYDGADLAEVAALAGIGPEEVVARHVARVYTVLFLGFVPGFAYLGDLDPRIVLPRRATPRTRVPAGALGIAGGRTGVYPGGTPGGWNLIGSTDPAQLWSAPGVPRLGVGDTVRFVPA